MSILNAFLNVASSYPPWLCPSFVQAAHDHFQTLSLAFLNCNTWTNQRFPNKSTAIKALHSELLLFCEAHCTSTAHYLNVLNEAETRFGKDIIHLLYTVRSCRPAVTRGILPLTDPKNLSKIENAFPNELNAEIAPLCLSLNVHQKQSNASGGRTYFSEGSRSSSSSHFSRFFSLSKLLAKCFQRDLKSLYGMDERDLADVYLYFVRNLPPDSYGEDLVLYMFAILEREGYPASVLSRIPSNLTTLGSRALKRRDDRIQKVRNDYALLHAPSPEWPQLVPFDVIQNCIANYRKGIVYVPPPICACCGSEDRLRTGSFIPQSEWPPLKKLKVIDPIILEHTPQSRFIYICKELDGLLLDPKGIQAVDLSFTDFQLYLCRDCHNALKKDSMPRLALNNRLFRGVLPFDIESISWVEEMACALYRTTAHVARIFGSSRPEDPLQLHGNVCAHPLDLKTTARRLPWAPADLNDHISIVFVGPKKLTKDELRKLKQFVVRKSVIRMILNYFCRHNRLYIGLPPPDEDNLSKYPENDILPGLAERIIYDHESSPSEIFQTESSGFDDHPAELLEGEQSSVLLETSGIYDAESNDVPARYMIASAAQRIAKTVPSTGDLSADMILRYEKDPIVEYNNPDLIAGICPLLFPLGIAGLEDSYRETPISLESHVELLLDQSDRQCRYHHFFAFIVLNLIQRRKAHLHTSLSISSEKFRSVMPALLSVSPSVLSHLADHLKNEKSYKDFTPDEENAHQLLRQVNIVAAKVPGSQASKLTIRHQVRSYFGYFGLPHIWFTFNPSVVHSPIFQVIYGDKTVDLSERYPEIVQPRSERALRVARDPVAAADFFDFMYHALFRDLFGWDFDAGKSSEQGGIFGHLRAFYGCAEMTERGCFHGHFLIFLRGGLNPSEVHKKLEEVESYHAQFFSFWESIIRFHLPNVEYHPNPDVELRSELPPDPPLRDEHDKIIPEYLPEWQAIFNEEHRKVGEKVHRHQCRKVCFKGRSVEDGCRFGFPHDVVEISRYDSDTHSIILARKEGDVNGNNPILVVYCRHNTDLNCILSGRAAKAAMFYISDYMTKMDLPTNEILSLLSKAVASLSADVLDSDPVYHAKRLLHRCLTHLCRKQQIHAQQCARYLRGMDDSISSHSVVPLPSSNLMLLVRKLNSNVLNEGYTPVDTDIQLHLSANKNGTIEQSNQVQDYLFRDIRLSDMCFFDFVRFVGRQLKSKTTTKHTSDSRVGVLSRYSLLEGHPLHETHELIRRTNIAQGDMGKELVPVMIGMYPPRRKSEEYKLFVLAHLKPFSLNVPLLVNGVEEEFANFDFAPEHQRIMDNWEEIHECADERDAERLRKRANWMAKSVKKTNEFIDRLENDDDYAAECPTIFNTQTSKALLQLNLLKADLSSCSWLKSPPLAPPMISLGIPVEQLPDLSLSSRNKWIKEAKKANDKLVSERRCRINVLLQSTDAPPLDSEEVPSKLPPPFIHRRADSVLLENHSDSQSELMPEEVMDKVAHEFHLNEEQRQAFFIIAKTFVYREVMKDLEWLEKPSLVMFLTGPGGTGKSHVVRAVQKVMEYYRMGHCYRSLAFTANAALLIEGTTLHSGCNIKVQAKNKGRGSRLLGEDEMDLSVVASVNRNNSLREQWRNISLCLVDEISLLDQALLADVDASLRYGKENNDQFFGGITMIFAGDQFQYAPVGTPLYSPIKPSSKSVVKESELKRRLGRLAWRSINAVIELHEQKRMESDTEYGSAVNRLRTRECTDEDVKLFNTRVIKSYSNPDGVVFETIEQYMAPAIVPTNATRQSLNEFKAEAICTGPNSPKMITVVAHDYIEYVKHVDQDLVGKKVFPSKSVQEQLLAMDTSSSSLRDALPGFLKLYIGMPVILRGRNQHIDLGIINGAKGFLRKLDLSVDENGFTYCECALVEFPDSKVQLEGLPHGYYPVEARIWNTKMYVVGEDGNRYLVNVKRYQLPFEAAFSRTGQSAQGSTMDYVLCNLQSGGFGAYVAASRAKTRQGLFITKSVTLEDLNSPPIPYDLWFEARRFQSICHNTKLKWGFIDGMEKDVPDAESEQRGEFGRPQYRFEVMDGRNASGKRNASSSNENATGKKQRRGTESTSIPGLDPKSQHPSRRTHV